MKTAMEQASFAEDVYVYMSALDAFAESNGFREMEIDCPVGWVNNLINAFKAQGVLEMEVPKAEISETE